MGIEGVTPEGGVLFRKADFLVRCRAHHGFHIAPAAAVAVHGGVPSQGVACGTEVGADGDDLAQGVAGLYPAVEGQRVVTDTVAQGHRRVAGAARLNLSPCAAGSQAHGSGDGSLIRDSDIFASSSLTLIFNRKTAATPGRDCSR